MASLRVELVQYCRDIIDGKIVACQKHKWACMRFLRDLEREGTQDFPYVFKEDKAVDFLEWMKLFKHRKGILAGQFINPHIIQKFIFGNIYGWYNMNTGYRRFTKSYWQVARKGVKSQSAACVGSYELVGLREEASEVYCAATKRDQARIVHDETDAMLVRSILKDKVRVAYGRIFHDKSGSFMRVLSEEDRKTGDGLNPQCGIIDEYQAHETTEIYDILESGMLARTQPLLFIITTAGLDTSYPCYTIEYQLVAKILNPDIDFELDHYFVMINELDVDEEGNLLDDIQDESCWEKANPIAASYPEGREFIRRRVKTALEAPEKMTELLTKTFNVWVNAKPSGYMTAAKWKICGEKEFPEIYGREVFAGVDLSSRLDLTSVSFDIPLDNEQYAAMSHSFMPEEKFKEKKRSDKAPYDLWERQGWLTVTPGAEVDYSRVIDYILEKYEEYNWDKGIVAFDRVMATWMRHVLDEAGFTPVDIPQSFTGLSEATKDFRLKVYCNKIYHQNDPLLGWAISNAIVHAGPSENIMLSKVKSGQRIDPIASLINAHTQAMLATTNSNKPTTTIYANRGFLSL